MNLVSPVASIIDQTISKKIVSQVTVALGLASIPVLGPILSAMVGYFVDLGVLWLLTKTIIGGARVFVMMQVDWSVKDVEEMKEKLQDVLDNPNKYTAEQQAAIEKDFDDAAVKLIKIVNARVLI